MIPSARRNSSVATAYAWRLTGTHHSNLVILYPASRCRAIVRYAASVTAGNNGTCSYANSGQVFSPTAIAVNAACAPLRRSPSGRKICTASANSSRGTSGNCSATSWYGAYSTRSSVKSFQYSIHARQNPHCPSNTSSGFSRELSFNDTAPFYRSVVLSEVQRAPVLATLRPIRNTPRLSTLRELSALPQRSA